MKISKTELSVMQAIWACEPCSSDEVISYLNQDEDWHEKTVKTLLNRLLKKQVLSYERNGRQYLYFSNISKTDYQKSESKDFVSNIFQGKVSSLVASFAQENTLDKDDVEALKTLIQSWEKNDD
ncbi:BlaI/MecI/CopY family transcriptional regulator [Glaciecola sp. KUL10]|jgi:predicted transcriptional regulator|uniref:BlaI/MecI/CopY family transcriptional regulator n=1 Tax=Glaciecola sp. (strain KUL10) TaxID=2161813 RepID=UPI000D78657A|nr:BlaI/MecI/CopY family transcriptional regulator [Glaciecola sp. KUL10]GBL04944.1 BlaI family transcriptional regulator [Glaciecola sp. KUL10]